MLSPQHRDLMDLMTPTFSGMKNNFGKEIEDLIPLSFDRINEGQPFSSSFLLSRLPIELVWHIIKLVPQEDLGNLALVNRDCRQLARSRQFASIKLDYSDSAIGILGVLVKEHEERSESYGKTKLPSIGACIRKITVATNPRWITYRHKVEISEEFTQLEVGVRKAILDEACKAFFGEYAVKIGMVLSNIQVLPHLEYLLWTDRAPVDKKFFEMIISSNLRHLTLRRVSVNKEFSLDPSSDQCRWRLSSLYLDVIWSTWSDKEDVTTSLLICNLLCLAAPTLESLTWACFNIRSSPSVQLPSSVSGNPSFRRLQDLKIESFVQCDPAWLDILIQPGSSSPIRFLEVDISRNPKTADFFNKCGYLPNLEVFVWRGFKMNNPSLSFLEVNSHIRKLRIDGEAPHFLEEQLLPLLCRRFKNLVSLSLRWPEDHDHIPQSALDQISTLHGLEQLCLSAGRFIGWRHSWVINHNTMQNCVRSLRCLRKLAFSRDTYIEQNSETQVEGDPERYYEDRLPRNLTVLIDHPFFREGDTTKKLELAWEMQHRNDMVAVAARYASLLPELEWVYLGQHPMRIDRSLTGITKPIPLSTERDDCWTYLQRMFGRENDLS
ncbi:hypothetical protein CC78DRAFT_615428 [Lojkania enalia]|uniref:F-box domain-containing protein n=1 Tax=Lojkania enalia TaxID=147567 RepID=A0A9P4KBB5_9PLEO|nr:hypothetical protein CC78DRAFT_615428 [Didymosphaeria enalia]